MSNFDEDNHIKENLDGLLKVIQDQISFRMCTGCSGIENPYSQKLGSEIGMGCEECHETGVVLEDYRGFSEFVENQDLKIKLKKANKLLNMLPQLYGLPQAAQLRIVEYFKNQDSSYDTDCPHCGATAYEQDSNSDPCCTKSLEG